MRSTIRRRLILAGACLILGRQLWGQLNGPESQTSPRLEVAVLYDSLLSNVVRANRFWMQGGSVQMPFAETFWAKGFGMLTDKYGIPWMVNCEKPM